MSCTTAKKALKAALRGTNGTSVGGRHAKDKEIVSSKWN